ncbi:unnamed protein product [Pocillopora meandrina]|uniref:Uncharacterized protein n=1 Tax=Pocillopora meandrina TaxID=46732 RepID=A0AAU9W484_9CNID|nr:unnamed protein product [Pocillopora meandrina]
MLGLHKLISSATILKIYKAFILPHFQHYSTVWRYCGAQLVCRKLPKLYENRVYSSFCKLQPTWLPHPVTFSADNNNVWSTFYIPYLLA